MIWRVKAVRVLAQQNNNMSIFRMALICFHSSGQYWESCVIVKWGSWFHALNFLFYHLICCNIFITWGSHNIWTCLYNIPQNAVFGLDSVHHPVFTNTKTYIVAFWGQGLSPMSVERAGQCLRPDRYSCL